MTSPLSVIILAAGKGTRMQSAKPKVLQTLAGKSLLSHVLDTCHQLTVDETIIVHGFGSEQVQAEITTQYAQSAITWVAQTEQLGTGHAVKVTLSDLPKEGQSLILYGDVPLVSCQTLSALRAANAEGMSMLTLTVDNPFGLGRIKRDEAGNITAIVEQKDASTTEQDIKEINSGIYCVDNALLHKYLPELSNDNAQQEYYLTDIVKMAVADDISIAAIEPEHTFEIEGVNNRQQLASLERTWQGKLVADLQEAGVQFADPTRVDIRGTLTAGQDVFVDVNVVFEGDCTLGNNVYIEAGCVIKNAQIGNACHIKPHCVIDRAEIGAGVDIGPFAHLRPETVLSDNSKIGNFVEIKKSVIGRGSKVNHLSYVGDATVGTDVNVGAGVITCNYDGVNKSQTIIENNAFIGSNASLVAPVTIGDTATVAAGSVVTKDVDAKALAFGRARQIQKDNFQRPTKK
ncbi:bifunctional UDP-N-acetylglucosamine diphosphorylase/glucosamine-1-phosphate N-acetyltransferase GlmU [Psychrobacter sp.]|uniref:bifunctional UDP-N-acetylglucosamine diphosphorylase/glucosamine-1-phosphate N-acetyltransferase GlmU n=1 Tax=Psychrobacter sp. TaxID=56811 RepID=UPI0026498E41|nr:bifunctional UDP-N-acetylglucosamine diphosphorylase/glucosamine-1-phosphate N-acetyltransferase GlmU [Psychrobacter sp.]MDN6275729.1 bifunctional UDP-N-acetylglucosamine diphosphorylase/glucosamine-1-phosphate N-acetyltransferase GlmU [Psychrobacter sp.]MDN6307281.1 bifunctional UDP-N-acetylglucosamine diphosphorylase/glucosamine-1-phosphate N-acetyltransferase GlmU [Psychrobacter sp.]